MASRAVSRAASSATRAAPAVASWLADARQAGEVEAPAQGRADGGVAGATVEERGVGLAQRGAGTERRQERPAGGVRPGLGAAPLGRRLGHGRDACAAGARLPPGQRQLLPEVVRRLPRRRRGLQAGEGEEAPALQGDGQLGAGQVLAHALQLRGGALDVQLGGHPLRPPVPRQREVRLGRLLRPLVGEAERLGAGEGAVGLHHPALHVEAGGARPLARARERRRGRRRCGPRRRRRAAGR